MAQENAVYKVMLVFEIVVDFRQVFALGSIRKFELVGLELLGDEAFLRIGAGSH